MRRPGRRRSRGWRDCWRQIRASPSLSMGWMSILTQNRVMPAPMIWAWVRSSRSGAWR